MFENEEEKLREFRSDLEDLKIPTDQLNKAIHDGFRIGDKEFRGKRRKRGKSLLGLAIAAVFILSFAASIRISPVIASSVASIPGMEKVVRYIHNDKGILGIVANNYFQQIDASQTNDNFTLTINEVILDETGMVISTTLEAPYKIKEVPYKNISIHHNGKEIPPNTTGYHFSEKWVEKPLNQIDNIIEVLFSEKQTFATQDFTLEAELNDAKGTVISIPFTVPKKVEKGKVYALNEEIEIDNQKMTIKNVTVYPLRVAVDIEFDQSNSMEIMGFDDIRIEDENGEVWSSAENGIREHRTSVTKRTIYLQSNYFAQPKSFHLKMNKIQALPKDEAFLLVDLEKQKVLKQPSSDKIGIVKINGGKVEASFTLDKNYGDTLFSDAVDADGEVVKFDGQETATMNGRYVTTSVTFDGKNYNNPIKINFGAYPNYINGNIAIELK
ncbi:DUF4179 domain-containing protein [Sporosarcina sp. FA9]|uniref:DUF4179 domain-containing protein n=1 Tax=Sporosarcina sp. FA9 TaxID=3413030 RepID=UPI003F6582BD